LSTNLLLSLFHLNMLNKHNYILYKMGYYLLKYFILIIFLIYIYHNTLQRMGIHFCYQELLSCPLKHHILCTFYQYLRIFYKYNDKQSIIYYHLPDKNHLCMHIHPNFIIFRIFKLFRSFYLLWIFFTLFSIYPEYILR